MTGFSLTYFASGWAVRLGMSPSATIFDHVALSSALVAGTPYFVCHVPSAAAVI